jgi:hypothetical protein
MTPNEYHALYEGWVWRTRTDEDRHAIWTAVLVNHMGTLKTARTAEQLLGRPLTGPAKARH